MILSLNNVSYSYSGGSIAVDNITITFNEAEKTAIIGPNGSGKTTLINLFNGILTPAGEIFLNDKLLNRGNLQYFRKNIGVVFQNPDDMIINSRVEDEILFTPVNLGVEKESYQQILDYALSAAGIEHLRDKEIFNLSFGEKKLVTIAAALSAKSNIVAMDEPTSGLDDFHRKKIIDFINNIDSTVIFTTHDLDMAAETADRVILINNGRVIKEGKPSEILSDNMTLNKNNLNLPKFLQKITFKK